MKIIAFKHTGVRPDGTFRREKGCIETKGKIIMSEPGGGCGLDGCHCSDGHWITILEPRTNSGIVKGLRVEFATQIEMNRFLKQRELIQNQ